MRILLLLSALLSAMVGAGANARPVCALTHQTVGLGGVQAPKAADAAQARRPATRLPRIIERLTASEHFVLVRLVAWPTSHPFFSMRLRV